MQKFWYFLTEALRAITLSRSCFYLFTLRLELSDGPTGGGTGILLGETDQGTGTLIPFSLKTQADSIEALAPLRNKLNLLNQQRGEIGAFQSRITAAIGALEAVATQSQAAESRIRDADIATETANLVRLQIQQQAAAAVLGQANQQPGIAIQLIRDVG